MGVDLKMQSAILKTLEYSKHLIISPDIDGFMSADLLNRKFGSVVVGTYDKNILTLADDIDPKECLFVDCDMSSADYVSIGNHMRQLEDNMSDKSFNPNRHFGTKRYYEKFPYATCFLISATIEAELTEYDLLRMAHADSTYKNMEKYGTNMRNWSTRLRYSDIEPIINQALDMSSIQTKYPKQGFVSRRRKKEIYLEEMNEALYNEKLQFAPVSKGIKYMAGKMDKNFTMRYMSDIISYAEIYSGEYSVTYNQEIEWN